MTAVDTPPLSGPLLVSGCSTLEMDVDPSAGVADARAFAFAGCADDSDGCGARDSSGGPCDAIRQSLHDVSSARIRMYHHQCDQRLKLATQLLREREERGQMPATAAQTRTPRGRRPSPGAGNRASSSAQWKLVRESNDIRVFRQRKAFAAATGSGDVGRAVMAIGTVHGSLGDVMNGLYADTTRESRVLHTLLSRRYVDARVLRVDKRGSDQRPFQFAGVTWTAVKMPGLGLCKLRDFLCFKKMDCFRDDLGDDMGYLVLQSIDPIEDYERTFTPSLSPLHTARSTTSSQHAASQSTRYVRGFMSLAVIFKRLDDDRVSLFAHGEFSPHGRMPPLLSDLCISDVLTSLANAVRTGEAKNLTALLHAPTLPLLQSRVALAAKTTSTALDGKPRCGVCARSLYFWDAPRACRSCWAVTCRTCRVTRPIFCSHYQHFHDATGVVGASAATASVGGRACTETFCLVCVCSVTPNAGALVNAQLLARLEKKRKRSPLTAGRPSSAAALLGEGGSNALSMTGSLPVLPLSADDDGGSHVNGNRPTSSISVTSSRPESEKHQQMRLSLNPRPTKRRYDRPSYDNVVDNGDTGDMLEVLEHQHYPHGMDHMMSTRTDTSLVSSSLGTASLVSFSSADLLAPPSTSYSNSNTVSLRRGLSSGVDALSFGSFRRLASAMSSGSAYQQPAYHQYHIGTGAGPGASLQRRRSTHQQQQQQQALATLAAALQRKESMTVEVNAKSKKQQPRQRHCDDENDEDYYQKMLSDMLRSTASNRSLALLSASSISGADVASQASGIPPPLVRNQEHLKPPEPSTSRRRSSRQTPSQSRRRRMRSGRGLSDY